MHRRVVLFALLLPLVFAEPIADAHGLPYTQVELDAITRSVIASLIAISVFLLSVLHKPRPQRPTWDIALARALLTGIIAVVAVLIMRSVVGDNLAAEWLTAAVVGSEGPGAIKWLRERFGMLWKKEGGDT